MPNRVFSCKPDAVVDLLDRALKAGFTADYVLRTADDANCYVLKPVQIEYERHQRLRDRTHFVRSAREACFVLNWNKRLGWLTILSTDVMLDAVVIVRIYGIRWSIEAFF